MRLHRYVLAAALITVFLVVGASAIDIVATVVASGTADTQGVAAAANLRLCAFSVTEDAGSPAVARVRLRNGTADTDPEMFDIQLSASQSARMQFFPTCIPAHSGVFVDRVSGTTRLTLYTRQGP